MTPELHTKVRDALVASGQLTDAEIGAVNSVLHLAAVDREWMMVPKHERVRMLAERGQQQALQAVTARNGVPR